MDERIRHKLSGSIPVGAGDVKYTIDLEAPANVNLKPFTDKAKDLVNYMGAPDQFKLDFDTQIKLSGVTVRIDKPRKGAKETSITLTAPLGPDGHEATSTLFNLMQTLKTVDVSFKEVPKAKKQPAKKAPSAETGKGKPGESSKQPPVGARTH